MCSYFEYSSYQLREIDKYVSVGEALKCSLMVKPEHMCLMQLDIDTFYCDKAFIWQKKAHI